MSTEQRDVSPENFNDNCIRGNESVTDYPDPDNPDPTDRVENSHGTHGNLKHTWQWQAQKNSTGSDCLHSHECDCDDLNLAKALPCSLNVNASLRAVAQICGIDANPYEYEIIDIQASPNTGHIMHPPDPCQKHNRPNQPSR